MLIIDAMHTINLRKLDLNLLLILQILLEEHSVSRAAARLGLTQSAMSHALSRLRRTFDDVLLVRRGHTMIPTPRAEELAGPLRQVLGAIDQMVGPDAFDPHRAHGTIRIATADYGLAVLLPSVLRNLNQQAPHLNIECEDWSEHTLEHLKTGFLDFAWGGQETFPGMEVMPLFEECFYGVVSSQHPLAGQEVGLKEYLAFPHALVDIIDSRMTGIDRLLEKDGYKRRILLKIPHFLAAPFVINNSDLIATLPGRIADRFTGDTGIPLAKFVAPVDAGEFPYCLIWHDRRTEDPLHRWVRQLMRESARAE